MFLANLCESSIRRPSLSKIPRLAAAVLGCLLIALVLAPPVMAGKGKPGGGGKPSDPPTPPEDPAARFWHSLVNVTDGTLATGRLYMFGGNGGSEADYGVYSDFWSYNVADGWTLLPSGGRSSPGKRAHAGLACSNDDCLLAFGVYLGALDDAWLYNVADRIWSKVSCRRGATCPSARALANLAYDERAVAYVLFGGITDNTSLNDTWVLFDRRWTKMAPSNVPAARDWAAMTYVSSVPGGLTVDQVVMHGGFQRVAGKPAMLGDMYRWNGSDWVAITNTSHAAPALYSHSMVQRFSAKGELTLIVVGGYRETNDTPNEDVWQFTFADENTGKWEKIGSLSDLACTSSVHYSASRMAIDHAANKLIFFGGVENPPYALTVTNLNVCD